MSRRDDLSLSERASDEQARLMAEKENSSDQAAGSTAVRLKSIAKKSEASFLTL